ANLYTDIWDNGENGTPVNDENYLALYLYKVVSRYKDYIRFWEIWNEPGFDYTGARGWLPPGAEGNWWENNPDPCDYKLRAPIFHYIRTLRISYEVIKTFDPDAYITVAGTGFPSFLDAMLRNTDNPVDGSVTEEYPLKGGAYFDVMGYHSYPHLDGSLREWSNEIFDFVYFRHSDGAADGILKRQQRFQNVLDNYGYDGLTYPKKLWIITEANLPRATFDPQFAGAGSPEIQRNFMIKAVVQCIKSDIFQYNVFSIAESEYFNDADHEFDLMGFYKKIEGQAPYTQVVNDEGISYKTASDLLYRTQYDPVRTDELQLPPGVKGGAFINTAGQFIYVLWAETTEDASEVASASYSFPQELNINAVERLNWDYSQTGQINNIAAQAIELTATPIFLRKPDNSSVNPPAPAFTANLNSGCVPVTIEFVDQSSESTTAWDWSFPGGTPSVAFVQNPIITYATGGSYPVTLEVSNSAGTNSITQNNFVVVEDTPATDFAFSVADLAAFFYNATTNADSYFWDFGDNQNSTEENPSHVYESDGTYQVVLTASNDCGTFVRTKQVTISAGVITPPTAGFTSSMQQGCSGLEIQFNNQSSGNATNWSWSFPGGTPNASTEQHPIVSYPIPGNYSVILVASNTAGTNTFIQTDYVQIEDVPHVAFDPIVSSSMVSFSNLSTDATTYSWNFGDGHTSELTNPVHTYTEDGTYLVTLTASNACGSIEAGESVQILTAPTAGFSVASQSGCAPFTAQFGNQSSANTTNWAWSFPGGTPNSSTVPNPSVSYEEAGAYTVILVVSNDAGTNTLIEQTYINVDAIPEIDFTIDIDDQTVVFDPIYDQANSFYWDFGDGSSSNATSPNHTYASYGQYTVTLTATNDCGTNTTSQEIEITAAPSADFSADVTVGCTPLTVSYQNLSSQNATSWFWSFPGGNPSASTEANPVVIYEQPGAYSAALTATNAVGNDMSLQNNYIVVQNVPTAEFSATTNGAIVNFTNASEEAIDYNWEFGDGNFSVAENPSHTYEEDGTYVVVLHAMNLCGMVSFSDTIEILTPPQPGFTAEVTSGCAPLSVQFVDTSSTNVDQWNWTFNGGDPTSSTEQHPFVTYLNPGAYSVDLEVGNPAGSNQ
ncbi:MAG: PKD domain-containing protein, partial [Bacteroidota bacterium]